MNRLKGIRNIVFDLGGVILNIDYQLTAVEFKKLGVSNFEDIFSQFKQSKMSDEFETGKISEEDFYQGIKKIAEVDFSFLEFKRAWNAMLLDLPKERISLLEQLSKRYRLFLFSNTNKTHYEEFKKRAGNSFDLVFEKAYYSHKFGKRKPDRTSFSTILDEHKLSVNETLFIDDSEQHINSASSLGIQTILIKEESITDLFS